jgi:hypothetical protein
VAVAKSGGSPPNAPELLEIVSEEVRQGVARGEYEVLPGKVGSKPVIRYADSKQFVPDVGSGQYPGAPDLGAIAKNTAFMKSKPYREAIEALTPLGVGPEVNGSLAWWHAKAMWAAKGAPQEVNCQHEGCDKKHLVAFKPDGALIFKFMEMIIGKAPATVDMTVDGQLQVLSQVLTQRDIQVTILEHDPSEAIKRSKLIDLQFSDAEVREFDGNNGTAPMDSVGNAAPTSTYEDSSRTVVETGGI